MSIWCGGLLGTAFSPNPGASLANIARFSVATIGTLLVAAVVVNRDNIRRYAWAYALGVGASALISFAPSQRQGISHRAVGLTVHPNTLGLTCILAIGVLLGITYTASRKERWFAHLLMMLLLEPVIARSASEEAIQLDGTKSGLLRGACHRARIRATRWLAMTARRRASVQ